MPGFNEVSELAQAWLATEGLGLLRNLVVFALILLAGFIIAKLARRAVVTALERSHLKPSPLFQQFVANVTSKVIGLVSLIVGLGNLGVDTAALVAGLGVSGLILGFALQDTLSNFASGMMILLYQPFDVGDFVEVGGMMGKVQDLTLVSTILHTPDNKVVTFPNSKVWGNAITNFTVSGTRRVDLEVGVAYDSDVDEVMEIFFDILDDCDLVKDDPEPVVWMMNLGDSSLDFSVRGWVNVADFWPTRSELLRRVKYELDGAEVTIPFPQRELWLNENQVIQSEELSEERPEEESVV